MKTFILISFKTVCYLLALGLHIVWRTGILAVLVSWTGTLEAGLCVISDYAKNSVSTALVQESNLRAFTNLNTLLHLVFQAEEMNLSHSFLNLIWIQLCDRYSILT